MKHTTDITKHSSAQARFRQSALRKTLLFAALPMLAAPLTSWGENVVGEDSTQYQRIRIVEVVDGLRHPWAVAFLPDGRMLITEREGRLQLLEDGNLTRVSGLPDDIQATGQGGLMDVVLHHDYPNVDWIYLTYSRRTEGGTATTLIRGRLDGDALVDVERIFTQDRGSRPGRHYGSRLAWTNEGHLLMSVGDRGGDPPRAQDLGDHAGTLLRLNDDGSPAAGNPFEDDDAAYDEIYSYGHRNIQGLIVNPDNGEIWSTEHGPRGGDELNFHQPGENYGWPVVSLGLDYGTQEEFRHTRARTMEGMVDPVYEFLPTHAPSGLALVTSDRFPRWKGDLLAGGLRSERIRRLVIGDYEVLHDEEILLQKVGRIRDVREGPDGYIYVLNDHSSSSLYRIEPAD